MPSEVFLISEGSWKARDVSVVLSPEPCWDPMPSVVPDRCGTGRSCSETVVNKLEQAGFEEIPALVVSVKQEGLQSA